MDFKTSGQIFFVNIVMKYKIVEFNDEIQMNKAKRWTVIRVPM